MKKLLALLLAVSMVFALCACGSSTTTAAETQTETAATEGDVTKDAEAAKVELDNTVSTGRTDLNYAFTAAIVTADPHANTKDMTMQLFNWVYNGLVFADGQANITPDLAESWTVSDDGTVYTFQIRQGVKFHDGSDMTADDVVFSINRAIELAYFKNYTSSIDTVEKTGDWEVTITIKAADNGFLYNLYNVKITSQAIVEKEGDNFGNGAQYAGTGPYMITSYEPNTLIEFEKNPYYYGECGNIEKIHGYVIVENSTRLTALQTGELDFIDVPTNAWADIVASGSYNTELVETSKITTVIISNGNATGDYAELDASRPQVDVRVRQAMFYAIDRDALINVAVNGMGVKAYIIPNPKYIIGADDTDFVGTYEYDAAKAKELLAEAGYADGCDVGTFLVPKTGNNEAIATILVEMWKAVGITATIELADSTTASAQSKEHYQGVYITNSNYVHHMSNMKRAMHSGSFKTQVAKYNSEELDSYFDNAAAALTDADRDYYYNEVNRFINENCVNIPLFYETKGYAWAQGLTTTLTADLYYHLPQHWNWA